MEMLLMGACLTLFGMAVTCLTFKAATRESTETAEEKGQRREQRDSPTRS
jgi:hypothetical protein